MTERITYQDMPKGFLDGNMKSELYLRKSNIDHKLAELVKYRVSQINGCAYCLDMHHKEAIHLGETDLRLHGVAAWRDAPYYNEREKVALAFAEALTNVNTTHIDEELYEALSANFSKTEIADLTLVITQINSWNRINKVFATNPGSYKIGQWDN